MKVPHFIQIAPSKTNIEGKECRTFQKSFGDTSSFFAWPLARRGKTQEATCISGAKTQHLRLNVTARERRSLLRRERKRSQKGELSIAWYSARHLANEKTLLGQRIRVLTKTAIQTRIEIWPPREQDMNTKSPSREENNRQERKS